MRDPLEGLYFLCDALEFVAGVSRGDGFAVIEIESSGVDKAIQIGDCSQVAASLKNQIFK